MMREFWALLVVALVAGCASVSGGEAWRDVRITYDRQAVSGCQSVGIVSDEKWTRLQKDAYKFGGNTVLVVGENTGVRPAFAVGGFQTTVFRTGEAYRCPSQVAC